MPSTHEVINQSPPLVGYNTFSADRALSEALTREGGAWAEGEARELGALAGSAEVQQFAQQANENTPVLRTHDRFGRRIDEVEFHPAWHELMKISVRFGIHCSPWAEPREGAHVARAAMAFVGMGMEAGHGCPISMTYAVIPALRRQPELAAEWEPRIFSRTYDARFRPASEKNGASFGMAMTEKQGGSDVRANTTRAVPIGAGGPGGEYLLTGHKWFCSAPMSDGFLTLAQTDKGLSCFLLPRFRPDGTRNAFHIQRLKNKLGNKSNASSEIEYDGAWARMVGEDGRGVPTIIEMATHTRLDCVIGSASLMRQAVAQATHHCAHRKAFGKLLADQPLMVNVLADLAVESEAATILMMRLARAYDRQDDHEREGPFRRIATAISKFWVCKRAVTHVAEALECMGGNGFVEESPMPRLFREAPVNSVWEGSGNVMCLDVLRAAAREPKALEVFREEVRAGMGRDARFDAFVRRLEDEMSSLADAESRARRLTEGLALALQGSLVLQHAHPTVAEAFCASRLSTEGGHSFGTLPRGTDLRTIVERATPALA